MSVENPTEAYRLPSNTDLRQMRLVAGLTVRETAARVGCCEDTICSWESGKTAPDLRAAEQLLDVLSSEIDYERSR